MTMRFLILAGPTIVALANAAEQDAEGVTTEDARYPWSAGITEVRGVAAALVPADFAPGRYEWRDGAFARRPDPPPPPEPAPGPLTRLQFKLLLTPEERIAIRASADPVVVDFLDLLQDAQEVRLDDPNTVAGTRYMEGAGLLAAGRADAILSGRAP